MQASVFIQSPLIPSRIYITEIPNWSVGDDFIVRSFNRTTANAPGTPTWKSNNDSRRLCRSTCRPASAISRKDGGAAWPKSGHRIDRKVLDTHR